MAKKFNKDGLPTEVPTHAPEEGAGLFKGIANERSESDESPPLAISDEPTTRVGVRPGSGEIPGSSFVPTGEPKTVIHGGAWKALRQRGMQVAEADQVASEPKLQQPNLGVGSHPMADPVVGWLVIVEGPGMGTSLRLGMGQNSIGRGDDVRVRINFGDSHISRASHAVVTYDPKGNQFYVHQGFGTNLTYVEDNPVLSPTVLMPGAKITMGETTLRFVAFCDDTFTWADR